jgi:photosystem II stability/assembly factor-like uncharacterized protein
MSQRSIGLARPRHLLAAAALCLASFAYAAPVSAQRGGQRGNQTRTPNRPAGDTAAARRGTGGTNRGGSPPESGPLMGARTAQGQDSTGGRGRGASPYSAFHFRDIGPAAQSGRIIDIAVDPRDKSTWFIAAASGGVWKTTNAGSTFTPVFDNEPSYSIGTVVIDPRNSNVVWVGTGEGNAQRSVSYGDGVYKSTDGGRTWHNMGLHESEHIGKIVIDPRNSDIVYVAAQGPLSRAGGDRGLYKTTDGGNTWTRVLAGTKWAGAADVVLDPRNPDNVLASLWQRERTNYGYIAGGPESGLFRSTDGGATWNKVSGALGGSSGDMGRIGLAVSPKDPNIVYAIAEAGNNGGGTFRSEDGGSTFAKVGTHTTIGLYYTKLVADPTDADRVYSMDVATQVSEDGGRTFHAVGERDKHSDNHIVWVDPANNEHLLIGCDGGLFETFDQGKTYKYFGNLPLGQFYRIDVGNKSPFPNVFGGLQDNGSVMGPIRTRSSEGITNADWLVTAGGDGFSTRVDPQDPNTVYAESQNGGLIRRDLATGYSVSIVPEPEPGEPASRWYWDSPITISPFSHTRIYYASQRVWQSDDRGTTWKPVSPDLSRQIDRNRLKLMDRVWPIDALAKNTSSSNYGLIVALAESPLKQGQLWIGTDDGRIAVTEDDGGNWRRIDSFPGVPDTTYVSHITPSSHDANTVYASFDGHMSGDYKPYLLKSTDLGKSWTSIAGNLPDRGTVYVVIDDPKDASMLYAGTEFGLYFTRDGGKQWTRLRGGLPTIMVRDLNIQKRDDMLVAGTFGRGIWVLDDLSSLRAVTPQLLASNAAILPVERAPLYVQQPSHPGNRGSDFYAAPNPPQGATIYYYLRTATRTMRQQRQAAERSAERRGEDVYYPSWDSLRAEAREEAPTTVLTITDPEGRVVRRLQGPVNQGINKVEWNLRYAGVNPVTTGSANAGRGGRGGGGGFGGGFGGRGGSNGPLVAPGTYTVSMTRRVNGVDTPVGKPQTIDVYMLDANVAPRTQAIVAFEEQSAKLERAVLGANATAAEALQNVQALRTAIDQSQVSDATLGTRARDLENKLVDLQEQLTGDNTAGRYQEPVPSSLLERLRSATGGVWSSTLEAPTTTQHHQYDIVAAQFPAILATLHTLVDTDLRNLESAAEAAGVPWTPGRVPVWNP